MTGSEAATIHLGTPSPGTSSGLPAGSGEQPSGTCATATRLRPSWPCFGWGLPSHSGHPECWCALTAPFHPYRSCTRRTQRRRSVLCGTFPRVTSDCRWQSPCSVKSGLSSTSLGAAAARPTRPRRSPYSISGRPAQLCPLSGAATPLGCRSVSPAGRPGRRRRGSPARRVRLATDPTGAVRR
jgi:hypothetical protein